MQAVPVTDSINWVGAIDWNLRDFHGFETPRGSTYNAYLVKGEDKVALVDTVKVPFVPELLERVRSVVELEAVDYIVVNHVEPDHNGGLRLVMQACPNARVVASAGGVRGVAEYHGPDLELSAVGPDDVLDLGGLTLRFMPMPMVHWPDSMFTYCPERSCLMPNDAFGQHYTAALFDDQASDGRLWFEAEKYFVNIIAPYCRNVAQRLDEIGKLNLPIKMIAPSHGLIWRRGVADILAAYRRYAEQQTEKRVVICFDTMYDSTRRLAESMGAGLADGHVPYTMYHLPTSDRSDVLTDLFGARGFLIGSSTWHMNVLPTVATLLEDLKTLRFKDRLVGAFGSYGWQKLNVDIIQKRAREAGFEVPLEGVLCQWKPRETDLEKAREFGRAFAAKVKA